MQINDDNSNQQEAESIEEAIKNYMYDKSGTCYLVQRGKNV